MTLYCSLIYALKYCFDKLHASIILIIEKIINKSNLEALQGFHRIISVKLYVFAIFLFISYCKL